MLKGGNNLDLVQQWVYRTSVLIREFLFSDTSKKTFSSNKVYFCFVLFLLIIGPEYIEQETLSERISHKIQNF